MLYFNDSASINNNGKEQDETGNHSSQDLQCVLLGTAG